MMPAIINIKDKILGRLIGSLKRTMPHITVPIVPMPVHIAYAVPIGIVFKAKLKNQKLANVAPRVITDGIIWVKF